MKPKKPALCGVTYVMRCKKPDGHPGPCRFVGPHRYRDAEREANYQKQTSRKTAGSSK